MGGAERRLVDYAYDAAGNMLSADRATAFSLTYAYDARGRLARWQDAVGRTWCTYAYDVEDRVVTTGTSGPWNGDTFSYDAQARRTLYRPGGGAAVERTDYDADENVLAETDGLGAETRHAYEDGYRTQSTDPLGHVTRLAYDPDGNVTEVVDAEGRRTRLRWSGPGQLDLVLQTGGAWRYERDRQGNVVAARDPLGTETRFDWTPAGRLSAIHHPDGTSERRDYDAQHRLVAVTDPKGGVTRLSRDDPFGRVTAVTDPLGAHTRILYDDAEGVPLDTPSAVIRPDGVTIRRRFDGEGQVAEVVDGEGRVTRYAYGPFDELLSVTDPGGGVLSLAYDVRGLLVAVANAHGRTYRYDRDGAGRVVAETDFDGRTLRYLRDAAGRVVEQENGDGSRVSYAYDRSNLLVARRGYAAGIDPGTGAPEVEERFAYDARGLLVRAENGDGVVTLTRDALGRIVSESRDGRTVESRYDVQGHRIERRIGEGLSAYAYDPLGALAALTLAGPGDPTTIAFTRDALGRETGRAGGGFRLAQAFDPLGQIVRQRAGAGHHALERRWSWNRAYEPTAIADGLWGGTAYACDANGQVTEARHGEGLPPPRADLAAGLLGLPGEQVEVERFAYAATRDVAASDTALPGEPLGRALTPWLSSPGGKVKAARGADGSRILLTHDAQGRVVERRVERRGFRPKLWRYGWNALDRLVWCETPSGERWGYGYDPFGRRVWKRRVGAPGDGPGVVRGEAPAGEAPAGEAYLWDGDVVAQAAPVFADGRVAWDRAVSWHHEPGTFRPVARERGGVVHHVVTDHLGTPRELYDGQGRRAWSRSHRLWGGTRGVWRGEAANDGVVSLAGVRAARGAGEAEEDGSDLCPIGFPGQWADDENGLSYNRFRYYDAEAGQYVSPDPIGLEGGSQPQGYVQRPVAELDPFGLAGCDFNKSKNVNENQAVPSSSAEGARLKEHLRQAQKYGKGGVKELENGRIRYYGIIDPAKTPGDMIGRRVVREWNPVTGRTRTWHETIDAAGNVRQVRPETGGAKVHFRFDANDNYIGKW
ncbi:RHS repeat domain-containing protein [Methylobacterium terrae]|nr:RHS repeat domain-containing protein [Methylobacterium terrae]